MRRALAEAIRQVRRHGHHEEGSAPVEFIGVVVALVIPTLIILAGVSHVQAAQLAAESAANEAARMFALGRTDASIQTEIEAVSHLAFEDQGLDVAGANPRVAIACPRNCVGQPVTATVNYTAKLPLLGWLPVAKVKVSATGTSYAGQYVARG